MDFEDCQQWRNYSRGKGISPFKRGIASSRC